MNTKQVIVVRKDLKMRKGKMISQGAHASMKAILDQGYPEDGSFLRKEEGDVMIIPMTPEMKHWLRGISAKVCVSVDSKVELLALYEKAKEAGILCSLIQDSGLTEFNGIPTHTAVAIGPGEVEEIDKITSSLKLL